METSTGRVDQRLLVGLLVSLLSASLGTSAAAAVLPSIAVELDGGFGGAQWVALGYLIAMTVTSPAAGFAGDTWGRRGRWCSAPACSPGRPSVPPWHRPWAG